MTRAERLLRLLNGQDRVDEAFFRSGNINGQYVEVLKNPEPRELRSIISDISNTDNAVRFYIPQDCSYILVWDAHTSTHSDVADLCNLEIEGSLTGIGLIVGGKIEIEEAWPIDGIAETIMRRGTGTMNRAVIENGLRRFQEFSDCDYSRLRYYINIREYIDNVRESINRNLRARGESK